MIILLIKLRFMNVIECVTDFTISFHWKVIYIVQIALPRKLCL